MNTASPASEAIRGVLRKPSHGVAGLVDNLLMVCREHGLHLDWQAGRWRVCSFAEDWHELDEAPLRKSVFRAILARLATLCNEQRPGSCSPYGGQGEITVGSNPATVFCVVFTNTPSDQRLQLTHDRPAKTIGGGIMSTPLVSEGDPVLAGLLAAVPRLQSKEELLAGWVEGCLLPALKAFPGDATDAQIDAALSNLRTVLLERADVNSWLGEIANRGTGEYAGNLRARSWPSQLKPSVELPPDRIKNRTIVEQAHELVRVLTPIPTTKDHRHIPPAQANPGAK